MGCTGARKGGHRGLKGVIELPAVGKARQRILKGELSNVLLRLNTPARLALLLPKSTGCEHQQAYSEKSPQRQRLVQLDGLLVFGNTVLVGIDIHFESDIDAHQHQGNKER